ncbi:hypothetical protein SDRG_05107 [Saprolegnia diclina VS20]|uniref:Uncharacterized protein n=1 Tax=Saprolegnia diclina (strain VS20) TaxID=1156394 RepID=T0QHS8_SAPDV|nr:hypothetical protein SDRG_05107 [Saprolegnia diclina VS20]EQC37504.1 hypothetical protein SDRG_05107 [Saprolegnia diclina VS20]|eukprot:XP_008609024.1 hypothetical protein SDRG_05107 [Saprolegnia diclina VS20]
MGQGDRSLPIEYELEAALCALIRCLRRAPRRLAPPQYPRLLLVWRVACLVPYSVTLALDCYTTWGASLADFTAWNITLQVVYFVLAIKSSVRPRGDDVRLDLLFDVCLTSALSMAFDFWTLLATPDVLSEPLYKVQHGITVICFGLEFALNDRVVTPRHVALVALWPLLYGIFTWASHNVILDGAWPYDFMVVDQPTAPFWYLGIFLLQVAFFTLCLLVSRFKQYALETRRDDARFTSYGSV